MAAEREPPPLGDVKPTDFEELEDGEDLFTSTVSTLEVRRPRRGGRAARLAAFPLPRLVPSPLPGLARPGPVTPVTPAAPQVPVKGSGLARAARPPDCSLRAWGATSASRGRDPRTNAVLAGSRALRVIRASSSRQEEGLDPVPGHLMPSGVSAAPGTGACFSAHRRVYPARGP